MIPSISLIKILINLETSQTLPNATELVRVIGIGDITIIDKFKGGPVGLSTLATAVSESSETIEEVYEPFLIQEGFIMRTPRGREVTEKAYRHLGISRPAVQGGLF